MCLIHICIHKINIEIRVEKFKVELFIGGRKWRQPPLASNVDKIRHL